MTDSSELDSGSPFFSIITVVYNGIETVERTIRNVIDQSSNDVEYIVIDGGSTDGTLDVLKKYEDDIEVLVSEPDDGIFDAMNKGIGIASGEYVGIINSDDYYLPDTFDKVHSVLTENPGVEVVYGNMLAEIPGRGTVPKRSKRDLSLSSFYYGMPVKHPTAFVQREAYEKYGFFDLNYPIAADYELMLRFAKQGARFLYLDRDLAIMRTGGASTQSFPQGRLEALKALRFHEVPFSNRISFWLRFIPDFIKRNSIYFMRSNALGNYLIEKVNRIRYSDL